jgi:hypothetical protein
LRSHNLGAGRDHIGRQRAELVRVADDVAQSMTGVPSFVVGASA